MGSSEYGTFPSPLVRSSSAAKPRINVKRARPTAALAALQSAQRRLICVTSAAAAATPILSNRRDGQPLLVFARFGCQSHRQGQHNFGSFTALIMPAPALPGAHGARRQPTVAIFRDGHHYKAALPLRSCIINSMVLRLARLLSFGYRIINNLMRFSGQLS